MPTTHGHERTEPRTRVSHVRNGRRYSSRPEEYDSVLNAFVTDKGVLNLSGSSFRTRNSARDR